MVVGSANEGWEQVFHFILKWKTFEHVFRNKEKELEIEEEMREDDLRRECLCDNWS